ncbi:MAG: rRNA (guanine527-N7)-methyltransferase [Candidatus Binataceae bacterium]|nr:rRNA (guanine527-N7)-methyltransferase [Candidatus Binataceae bacterium]
MSQASKEPSAIGRAVRAAVAEELTRIGYQPSRTGFLDRIEIFATELTLWGSKLNLTAASDNPAEVAFHVIDSLAPLILAQKGARGGLADAFASGMHVLDLGSGAGFPGLILAGAIDADFVLLEARRKRASFLNVTATGMGLTNVRVESSRTDSITLKPVYDVVTARAFAEPEIVFKTAAVALKPDGRVLLYASPSQRPAIEAACVAGIEAPAFHEYEIPRGKTRIAHTLAVARRR